jgi:hypothetical protein
MLTLVKVICDSGPDKSLVGNHGLTAWQMCLSRFLQAPGEIKQIGELYRLLAPEAISIQVDGRLEKLDDRSMFGFLLNVFFSLWHTHLPNQHIESFGAITAANLEVMLATLHDSVLSPMKKKRSYISRYLSQNEVDRETPRNRKLFKRYRRGHYVLNPSLKIRQGDNWHDLHDVLSFRGWACAFPDHILYDTYYEYDHPRIRTSYAELLNKFEWWTVKQVDI